MPMGGLNLSVNAVTRTTQAVTHLAYSHFISTSDPDNDYRTQEVDPAFKRSVKSCGSSVQGFAVRNLIQRPQRVPRRVCSLSKKFNKRPLPKPPPEDKYYIVLLTLIVTTLALDNILTATLQSPVLSTLTLVLNSRTPQAPRRRIYYLI
ncbi:unnamed protein product [Pleuronectes platessa]|uniref:Uncharacterized protein n=1 Tax=Pleuronectes platessa TaxID=8262 RepID=A0A9N7VQG3_PLEPL|nr:unnamed protein product [Pleuronectes platessa]